MKTKLDWFILGFLCTLGKTPNSDISVRVGLFFLVVCLILRVISRVFLGIDVFFTCWVSLINFILFCIFIPFWLIFVLVADTCTRISFYQIWLLNIAVFDDLVLHFFLNVFITKIYQMMFFKNAKIRPFFSQVCTLYSWSPHETSTRNRSKSAGSDLSHLLDL